MACCKKIVIFCYQRCLFHNRLYSTKFSVQDLLHRRDFSGSLVSVQGWVRFTRKMGRLTFIHLSDGLSDDALQIVADKSLFSKADLSIGAAITVTGKIVPSVGPKQPVELVAESVQIDGTINQEEYPLKAKVRFTSDQMRRQMHLRPRSQSFAAFLRIRSALTLIVHQYFQERGFIHIDTPVITSNDCEGAGETFSVERTMPDSSEVQHFNDKASPQLFQEKKKQNEEQLSDSDVEEEQEEEDLESSKYFFAKPTFLTVSGQLHLESAASALSRVYTMGRTFRAESCLSRQHMAEFTMVEAELAFVDKLDTILDLVEDAIRQCSAQLLETRSKDVSVCTEFHTSRSNNQALLFCFGDLVKFPRITYQEANDILSACRETFQIPVSFDHGLAKEHERHLVRHFGNTPVFVTDFPSNQKPFYMKRSPDGSKAVCFDLLGPEVGEICGGSLRENDHGKLQSRIIELGAEKQLKWYADLRRFGHAPLAGFGIGFERYLQCLLGIRNIKDCTPFPRWYKHCDL